MPPSESSPPAFVTGAGGRVGLPLVRRLVERGHAVSALVRNEAKADVVREAGARVVLGSLGDRRSVEDASEGARLVFHLAGGLRGPGRETAEAMNAEATRQLVSVLRDRRDLDALVFTSSCAVYGDRAGLWVDEHVAPYPQTAYARSKIAAEECLSAAAGDRKLPVRIVRLAAVYGRDFPFLMADRIRAGKGWLPGEGNNWVPTVHVDDAVAGILRVAESGTDGAIYNLADRAPATLRELYRTVHRCVGGRPMRFWSTWVPSWVQVRLATRNERAWSLLGRRPSFTPDALALFTASSRMKVERMEKELGFEWSWPDPIAGVASVLGPASGP